MNECYVFVLCDTFTGMEFMRTEVDEPKPQIDAEFWERFMQGDCLMEYRGKIYDEENEDD
jgi:hypothetical protein